MRAIAHHNDDLLAPVALNAGSERFQGHGRDDEQLLPHLFARFSHVPGRQAATISACDAVTVRALPASSRGGKRYWLSLNAESRPRQRLPSSTTGQSAQLFLLDELQRVIDGRSTAHGDDPRFHDVAHAGREIGDQRRRVETEAAQHVIDPLVGAPARAATRPVGRQACFNSA